MKRKFLVLSVFTAAILLAACGKNGIASDNLEADTMKTQPDTSVENADVGNSDISIDKYKGGDESEDKGDNGKGGDGGEGSEISKSPTDSNVTDVSQFYGYDLPLIYIFDYTEQEDGSWKFDIEDCGDYFMVAGKFECPECVAMEKAQDEITTGEEGEFTTGAGNKYKVLGTEGYNNDQRMRILLLGEDGRNYEIMNVPAWYTDSYTNAGYYVIEKNKDTFVTYLENVRLKIDADTIVSEGMTFREYYDSGIFDEFPFESCYTNYTFDIHFKKNGKIDVFNGSELGNNGDWYYGDKVVYWEKTME